MSVSHTDAEPLCVYLAGALFSHAELSGNLLLATAVMTASAQRYRCALPQDMALAEATARGIRDADLATIRASQAALFAFEGAELDSGMVAEFIYAKMLDLPAVILRTDNRAAGESLPASDPWNLMCSFYPRTRSVVVDGMALYTAARARGGSADEICGRLYTALAERIVSALDTVCAEPPLPLPTGMTRRMLLEWSTVFPCGGTG